MLYINSFARRAAFFLFLFFQLSAFSQSLHLTSISGTFTPLSGGTAPATNLLVDDEISEAINIGFDFNFGGISYTQIKASSNGFISFNPGAGYDYNNNLTTSAQRPLIAPLWDDLSGVSGVATYQTSGISPNQVFTFEWLNWKWNYGAAAAVISFQVKLYETTNAIEFIYRQEANATNAAHASIGLSMPTAGFYSLSDAGTNPALSTITETNAISTKPATGQIYQFSIKPEPTNHVTSFATVSGSSSIVLNWTDATTGTTLPDGYLILASTNNSFTDPVDLNDITTDADLSDGIGSVKVAQGVQAYSGFSNIQYNLLYYIQIYPYSNSGLFIDYKTTATVPQTLVTCLPKAEPTNHITSFTATADISSITLNWVDATAGAILPDGYLILASTTNNFTDPVDLTDISTDADLSDGTGQVKVAQGTQTYSGFSNMQGGYSYYFRVYSYTNSGAYIDYKSTSTVPNATAYFPKSEPTNHAAAYNALNMGTNIVLVWSDAIGAVQPDGYLIMASTSNSFTDPVDLADIVTDTDLSDGSGKVKVAQGIQAFSAFTNLQFGNSYYFRLYPYTNSGTLINYLTIATVPAASAFFAKPEPTNHLTSFAATAGSGSITLDWTDAAGTTLPDGYLLLASATNSFTDPSDLNDIISDADLSDGIGKIKVAQGVQTYSGFINIQGGVTYYFRAYPYTNNETFINYKTTATLPNASVLFVKPEPGNHATSLTATAGSSTLTLNWTDAIAGATLPDGYLLMASTTDSFSDPVDLTDMVSDADLSDGTGNVKVAQGVHTFSAFTNLQIGNTYFFRLYPYTNSGTTIDYKTTATVPNASVLFVKPEPSNDATSLTATAGSSSITLNWTDAAGTVPPDGYILMASTYPYFITPSDLTDIISDGDLINGDGIVKIAQGVQTYSDFTNFKRGNTYYFKLYSFTNSGSNINYKDDNYGTVPTVSALLPKPEITYQLTSVSGTFTPLVGGTAPSNSINNYSGMTEVIDLGFSFNIEGTNYTKIKALANGYITFGLQNSYHPDNYLETASTEYRPILAPFWDNMQPSGGAATYQTTGTAPNRVFTFEWLNWKWSYSAPAAVISFQVKLYETTNAIEFIYRQEEGEIPGNATASIGLSMYPTGFYSLNNTSANPTLSSTTETNNIATKPATGQIYRFTKTCPEPGNHATSFAASRLGNNIALNWIDATGSTLPEGYLILASKTNSFIDPVDLTDESNDIDLSDGSGKIKIAPGIQTYSGFTNMEFNNTYYFRIYSYTNSAQFIDYKTAAVVPEASLNYDVREEPTNHVTAFSASKNGLNIKLSWTDATDAIVPDGYLILISKTNSFVDPIDLTDVANDTDLSDGSGIMKVAPGVQTFSGFINMEYYGTYYSRIYPYTNSGLYSNYKTTATVPESSITFYPKYYADNHATSFTATSTGTNIILNWTDATGTTLPDGYLLMVSTTNSFTNPIDGTEITSDADLSDGIGAVKVAPGVQTFAGFTNLSINTYYFKLYSCTNSGTYIRYQTKATVPVAAVIFVKPEPTNHVTEFKADLINSTLILSWIDATGAVEPDGYLLLVSASSSFTVPIDGTDPTVDNNLSDGSGLLKVARGQQAYSAWTNVDSEGTYFIRIYPYTNKGASIDYKNLLEAPQLRVSTQPFFTEQTITGIENIYNYELTSWADYDIDGDLDLIVLGYSSGAVSRLYINDGTGNFTKATGFALPVPAYGSLANGDYDNDGDLDILLTGDLGGYPNYNLVSKIYKNNGDLTFTEQTGIELTGIYYGEGAWGDYDNDGDLDIIIAGATSAVYNNYNPKTKIYKNNGDNTFTEQTGIILPAVRASSVAWGDYDNDGLLDLALCGDNGNYNYMSRIYRNNGNNGFTEQSGIALANNCYGSLEWGDCDNDGDLDLLMTGTKDGNTTDYNAKVYRNNGNNSFTELTSINLPPVQGGRGMWGDMDNDGDKDILLSGFNLNAGSIVKLYKNNGNNSFTERTDVSLPGFQNSCVNWTDSDNDGDLDIFAAGYSSAISFSGSKLFLNDCAKKIPSIEAPVGLNAVISGSNATLSWNKITTTVTPVNALSYNVQVGTASGSMDITSPQSLASGYRSALSMGNGQLGNIYELKRLKKGNYFWRVQAVDNKFSGGAFSTEGTFSITEQAQAYGVYSDSVGGKIASINWSKSTVSKCIVFAKENAESPSFPANNSTYTASGLFGTGTQIGSSGWYCVYNGTSNRVQLTGLKGTNSYTVAVYVYEGAAGTEQYYTNLTANNQTTFTTDIFTEIPALSIAGVSNGSVIWGDYDNDGDLDFLVAGSGIAKVYRNEGNDSFIEQTGILLAGVSNTAAAWGDYNNDGYIDILLAGSGVSKIYRNNGDNAFTEQTDITLSGIDNGSVAWGDSDNDGDLDILLSGSGISKLYRNNGDNTFTEFLSIALQGLTMSSVAWGDMDNDGYLDILLNGKNSSNSVVLIIYRNERDNTFTKQLTLNANGYTRGKLALGDYDTDGDLDILINNEYNGSIYSNNNDWTFTQEVGINLKGGSNVWGDYNNDGLLDILQTGSNYVQSWTNLYKNIGDNLFEPETLTKITGLKNGVAAWGDYDNDGDLDMLLAGDKGVAVTKIFRNDGLQFNTLPAAPAGISQSVDGSDVSLKWNSVTTDNTSSRSMTYNIEVGTSSRADNISASSSDSTGLRRIVEIGNGQLDTTFILKKLRKGNYFWSVQAIDNNFAGSPFSSEGTFTITESPQAFGLKAVVDYRKAFLQWNRGYSEKCVVFAKVGEATPVTLQNNTTYMASNTIGNGTQLGTTGWYCIYNGALDTLSLSGLKAFTQYTFQVFEYDGINGSEQYVLKAGNTNPLSFTTDLFTEQTGISMFASIWSSVDLACGDYDNDGFQDILISGEDVTKIYRNNGDSTFTEQTGITLAGLSNSAVAWGDYNNDNYLDILLTGSDQSIIYKNNGDNTFTEQTQIVLKGINGGAVDWGDYDNDGDLDILLASSSVAKVYRNNGNNTFSEQAGASLSASSGCQSASWGDYDNDGDLDILLAGASPRVYRNNGNNTFTLLTSLGSGTISAVESVWGDYDNDGFLDILLSGTTSSGYVSKIFHNNGNSTFTEQNQIVLNGSDDPSGAWGDYDNDGDLDILITGSNWDGTARSSKIYTNNGNNTFSELTLNNPIIGIQNGEAVWNDFDKDGDLDIVLSGLISGGGITKIYRNELLVSNKVPDAPIGIKQEVTEASVKLSWNPVTINATAQRGITYNVKMGNNSGGSNVVSPMVSATGIRTISAMGNAQTDTTFTLQNMKKGTYFWSVQAIDNSFAGGQFSAEGTFSISASSQAFGLSASNVTDTSAVLLWSRTNLTKCAVFIKKGSIDNTTPVNNITYSPSDTFGSGTQIGTSGWYCVYNDTAEMVVITGLNPSSEYAARVFEYDGAQGNESYLLDTASSNPYSFKTNLFKALPIATVSSSSRSSYLVDFDNDDYMDVQSLEYNSSRLFHNNGNNTYTEHSPIVVRNSKVAAWGDYNNDGSLDLLINGEIWGGGTVGYIPVTKLFKNNGNNSFTEQSQISLKGISSGSLDFGDYDNDGDLDIILGGSDQDKNDISVIYRNNGDNTFTEQTQISLPGLMSTGNLQWVDYDSDGFLDIFILNSSLTKPITKIFHNNGDNTFTDQTMISLPVFFSGGKLVFGDYDNDEHLDFLMNGYTSDGYVSKVFRNNGDNSYTHQTGIVLKAVSNGSLAWGDYDNNGLLDIIISGSNTTKIYSNNGDNTFTEQIWNSLTGTSSYAKVNWGDSDNDGDLDVLLSGFSASEGYIFRLYENKSLVANTKPGKPANLTHSYGIDFVKFIWEPPLETDETPASGLTYNLRVGTTSQGNQVLSAPVSVTGMQPLASMGNAGAVNSLNLKLMPGTYYWSVQAVDHGFRGGDYSLENIASIDSIQASGLSYKSLSNTEMLLRWNRGNGDRCIVFCKTGIDAVGALPKYNQSYVSDPTVEMGDQIDQTGWFCIYNGRADSTILSGLAPNTKYSVYVAEYLGSNGNELYYREKNSGNLKTISPGLFVSQGENFTTNITEMVADWNDFENDGDLDITFKGNSYINNSISLSDVFGSLWNQNNKDSSFSMINNASSEFSSFVYNSLAGGDFDNDGDIDYLVSGYDNDYGIPLTKVYRNLGNGNYGLQTRILFPGVSMGAAAWADYDNDGDLDLLYTGTTSDSVYYATLMDVNLAGKAITKIYKNNGNKTFTEQTDIVLPGVYMSSVAWGDYDNDGDLDILLSGASTSGNAISKVYRSNGSNSFTEQTGIALTGVLEGSVAWGDYDNDGDLDILLTGKNNLNVPVSKIYRNNGNNTFTELITVSLTGVWKSSAAWGDYDNDGKLDILLTGATTTASNTNPVTKVYRNMGDNSFTDGDFVITGVYKSTAKWGDYDNDGDLDFLLAGSTEFGNFITIYSNTSITKEGVFIANSQALKPTGLTIDQTPEKVILKWDPVSGDETPSNTLNYNVSISKRLANGTDSLVNAPQSAANGYHRVNSMGNTQVNNFAVIKNLPVGNYSWKVQAIDGGYKGGAWSDVNTFEIKNTQAYFSAQDLCSGYATSFTNLSTSTKTIVSTRWYFGDFTTSNLQNPSHIYNEGKTYTVALVVTDDRGVSDSISLAVEIKQSPKAGFSAPDVCLGTSTSFVNSTNSYGLNTSWQWNFGDGASNSLSTAQDPGSHLYMSADTFNVSLLVLADNGCSDTSGNGVIVTNVPNANVLISTGSKFTFCQNSGDSASLSAAFQPNCTYQWLNHNTPLAGKTDNTLNIKTNSGIYSVKVTNEIGACSVSSPTPIEITVNESPSPPAILRNSDPTTFCSGDSLVLQTVFGQNLKAIWKRDGGLVSNEASYTVKLGGKYSLSVANTISGCEAHSIDSVIVTVNPNPSLPSLSYGATTFCSGDSVTFVTVNIPSNTYKWKNGNSDITGATSNKLTANQSGNYWLAVTNNNSCTVQTNPIAVIVNPMPATPVIEQPSLTTFCAGDSVLLNISPVSGINYQWLLNSGNTGVNSNQLYAKTTGNYSIVLTNSYNCSAKSSGLLAITVNSKPALPSVTYGATTFCKGGSVSFSVPQNAGYTYQWMDGSAEIPGKTTNQLIANETGEYWLQITNISQCHVQTESVAVKVNEVPPIPAISEANNNTLFCLGTVVELKVTNTSPNIAYQWKRSGIAIDGANQANYMGELSAGDYSVTTSLGSCSAESVILTLSTKPAPPKPNIYARGPNFWILACDNMTAKDYRWYYNDQLISGAKLSQYMANKNLGNYFVEISDGGECYTSSDIINIPSGEIINGLSELTSESVTIFPNPTNGLLYMSLGKMLSGELKVEIVDALGKKVIILQLQDASGFSVDLSAEPDGVYFCKIHYRSGFVIKKVVKQCY